LQNASVMTWILQTNK